MSALRFSVKRPNGFNGGRFCVSASGLVNWSENRRTPRKHNYIAILISSARPVVALRTVAKMELISLWRVSPSRWCKGKDLYTWTHTLTHIYSLLYLWRRWSFVPREKPPAGAVVGLLLCSSCCYVGDINDPCRRRMWSSLSNLRACMHVRPVFRTILLVASPATVFILYYYILFLHNIIGIYIYILYVCVCTKAINFDINFPIAILMFYYLQRSFTNLDIHPRLHGWCGGCSISRVTSD